MMKFSLLALLALSQAVSAQSAAPLTFGRYLDAVEANSLELASQRQDIVAAQAGVSVAGLRPDPSLTLGAGPREFSREVQPKPRTGASIGLEWTVETGGKRDKRVQAAQSNARLSAATVDGFRSRLYAGAAAAFVEACRTRDVVLRQEASLRALSEVVRVNEVRRKAGDVGGLELLQSRTERDRFLTGVLRARADAQAALLHLSLPLGKHADELFGTQPLDCDFADYAPDADASRLVRQALQERDDVRIARAALENAGANAGLARANRYVDPTLSVGYGYTPHGRRGVDGDGVPVDGAPRSNTLSLSVSMPIPVSRLQRGELVQAESAVTQAMLNLRQAELAAETDVRVTSLQFAAARDSVQRYRSSVLTDAQKVLDGMRLSYRNGAASLLELLAAQRAADDTWLAYLQAQADFASAAVQLQLSIGQRPGL
jgi:cobalt-zinc-cadmium efflux system outer membrane protein